MLKHLRPEEITEHILITALRQGQPDALSLLYDKYAPVLLGLCTRMVRDPELAETLLQKTFLSIWKQKAGFANSKVSLLSWVILIARDTARASLANNLVKQFSKPAESSTFTPAEPETHNGQTTMEPGLQEYCCRLELHEKTALDLVYLKGYSCREAADQLGIPEETVKASLKMAIKHLGAERAV